MNELEKLHRELNEVRIGMDEAIIDFNKSMEEAMDKFRVAIRKAREIERQAGIGEEK